MNERIKELAEQAGCAWWEGRARIDMTRCQDELEKFAELIIEETLQVARAGIEFGDGMEDAVYKYFGVES